MQLNRNAFTSAAQLWVVLTLLAGCASKPEPVVVAQTPAATAATAASCSDRSGSRPRPGRPLGKEEPSPDADDKCSSD